VFMLLLRALRDVNTPAFEGPERVPFMLLAFAIRSLDRDEIYVLAARAGYERVTFSQCAYELTELRGVLYSRKQCERIFSRVQLKLLPFAVADGQRWAVAA
jgi:hypothetical protein